MRSKSPARMANALRGAVTPGYGHVSEHVSSLVRSGASHKGVLDPLFVVCNLLALAFPVDRAAGAVAVHSREAELLERIADVTGSAGLVTDGRMP